MARPDRSNPRLRNMASSSQMGSPQRAGPPQRPIPGGVPLTGGIAADIRALNSSILLITQKMKYIVRNEKILGRNLIVLNKKIKSIEDKAALNAVSPDSSGASSAEVQLLQQKVALLEAQIDDLRTRAAFKEELKELKYIIDSINPLEFATLSQVRELVDKRIEEKLKKEEKKKN
ncbi:MAG: hypothetical protein GX950_03540 [Candidatus Diapherotrites archaeon]|uniref:Uncharacterized protein n=1 Tax=Candidatus Iainarchaeum sp. TaxID=3101447 RepID=A0A7K4C094_9ARCH|nr:hypothetical protein [Candidatus Diapherotrites archaeon]